MSRRNIHIIISAAAAGAAVVILSALAFSGCKKESNGQLSFLSAVNAVSPVMPDDELELLYNSDFFYDRLEYNEKKVYMNMLRACREMKDTTMFDSVPEDTFLKAEYALYADHPEITWRWSYSGNLSGTVDTVYFDITDETKKNRNREAVQKADEIIAGIDPGMSDYDKLLTFYNMIVDETDYVENEYDQDMTSVFIERDSVCAGYSRAFQYLCKASGIECAYIEGMAYGFQNDDEEAHAWNLVKLDDKYYWVDVTWGDPISDDEKYKKTYSYFCSDDSEFFETHKPEAAVWISDGQGNVLDEPLYSFELPLCEDSSRDYYKQTGAFFGAYDREEIGNYLGNRLEENPEGVVEFKIGDKGQYVRAVNDLFDERAYVYDIVEDSLGSSVANTRDVYFIQDDTTHVVSVFLE